MRYPAEVNNRRRKLQHAYELKGRAEFIHRILGKWFRVGLTADEYEALKRLAPRLVNSMPVALNLPESDFRRFQRRRFQRWIEQFNDARGLQGQRMTEAAIPEVPDDDHKDDLLALTPGGDFEMPATEWVVDIEDIEE
jgi:hypothetical protein